MILTIKGIEQKSGTNTRGSYTTWIATFTNGMKASTFDPDIGRSLVAGETRDFEIEQKGDFKNIKSYGDLLDPSAAAPASPGSASVPDEVVAARDRRIAMESAVKSAAMLLSYRDKLGDDTLTDEVFRNLYLKIYQDIIAAGEDKIRPTSPPSQNRTTSAEKSVAPSPTNNPTDDTQSTKEVPRTPDNWKAAFEGAATINELQGQWNEMQKALQPTGAQKVALQALFKMHKERIEANAMAF